ncbi:unnamed protein product [Nippostrongylus brasiliensis]|uniref:Mitogen-activated protein kinase kinase kinase 4 (inferred by orthology to a human protein) n=1 Tax=Nippostrongylus brasiliensis TaxID=27835 RepID=A0A0N4YFG2_NIPBR|nr:unnamed protein product [Nippostrongylus brasiliensis]
MMEYCSEGTLEKICREGLDEELVRRYTNSLLRAVAYMHSQKVVHRDIKPANIFLDLQCVLKLGDFGCSVRLHDQATVYGEIAEYAGTVQYMAPEVLTFGGMAEDGKYRGYGRAVDIWSIGCVVLEMVNSNLYLEISEILTKKYFFQSTGRRPWPDLHPLQITMRVRVQYSGSIYPMWLRLRARLDAARRKCKIEAQSIIIVIDRIRSFALVAQSGGAASKQKN